MRCQGFLRASIFHSTVNMNTVGRGHLLVRGGHSTYSFAHYELVTRENQSDNTRVLLYYLRLGCRPYDQILIIIKPSYDAG